MWQLLWYLRGWYRLRIEGASPEWIFERLSRARIAFREPRRTGDLSVEITVSAPDLKRTELAAMQAMCSAEILSAGGFLRQFGGLFRRPLFLLGLLLCAVSAMAVPKFVFFYEVSGHEQVPAALILRELDSLGVGVGTYGPSIHPQELKNQMLRRIPKLQWFTVTQNGMRAVVTVRERSDTEPVEDRKTPRNVVASCDGVLTRVETLAGACLCQPGQAVRKGEVLVSGYADMGYKIQVSSALAEIYAKTRRETDAVSPSEVLQKTLTERRITEVSIIFGQNRRKIYQDSRNLQGECDKITLNYPFTLPGGFTLPITLQVVKTSDVEYRPVRADELSCAALLEQAILDAAQGDMIAGTVLRKQLLFTQQDGLYRLTGTLECEEMIARMVEARIFEGDVV